MIENTCTSVHLSVIRPGNNTDYWGTKSGIYYLNKADDFRRSVFIDSTLHYQKLSSQRHDLRQLQGRHHLLLPGDYIQM